MEQMQTDTKKALALRWLQPLVTALVAAVVVLSITFGTYELNQYTQQQLYIECRNQLSEIMEQIYEKLGNMLENQWGYLISLDANLQRLERPMNAERLAGVFQEAMRQISARDNNLEFIALDEQGHFYTTEGRQGVWDSISDIDSTRYRQSILVNDWQSTENLMAFVYKLETPISLENGQGEVQLTHLILLKRMSELTPYFRSSAFHDRNVTYVLKNTGVKMYTDSTVDQLTFQGRNLYHALRKLEYPHDGDFDACLSALEADSYVCTNVLIEQEEYYLCLKQLDGYDWTVLFLVPSEEVASSTRAMVASLLRVFLFIVLVIVALCCLVFFILLQFRQNQRALEVQTMAADVLTTTNDELERANEKLVTANRNLQKAQTAASEALAVAESASKAKTDFLSNMSHDIRTPMNAIVGISTLMENELDDPAALREHIHKLQASSQHLLGLINDVLDMSKIESGKTTLNLQSMRLSEEIQRVATMVRPQAGEKSQTLAVDAAQIEHDHVLADAMRLRQVLINLLSNAVKYTPAGGKIEFAVQELPRDGHSYARYAFTVADNGIGMSSDFLEHLYDSFSRAENSVTNKVQGTGLGMAITKSLVELMGGSIRVESALGKGTRFEVLLEFKLDEDAAQQTAAAASPAPADDTPVLRGMRFLCAEDNEINAEILQALLENKGATCTIYPDGKAIVDAFASVQPGDYDMILMDVQMPVMNGYEATRAIRSGANPLGKTIPILAMTANAFSDDVQHSLDAGMDAHLSKPVDMKLLEQTVRRLRVAPPPAEITGAVSSVPE